MSKKLDISLNEAKDLIVSTVLTYVAGSKNRHLNVPPIYIEGEAGVGKSTIIKQAVEELENILGEWVGYVDYRLSLLSSSDLQGIPNMVKQPNGDTVMKWVKDHTIPSTLNSEINPLPIPTPEERNNSLLGLTTKFPRIGLLMLDEMNQVEEANMLSLLYNLLLDKKINDLHLPPLWFIVGAGNRVEDGGVYNRLPAPVRDRIMILNITVPNSARLQYFEKVGFHPTLLQYLKEKELAKDEKGNSQSVLTTYDATLEEDDIEGENYVFATSRSWQMLDEMLKSFEEFNTMGLYSKPVKDSTFKAMMCGIVGEDVGSEFYAYYKSKRSSNNLSTLFGEGATPTDILKAVIPIEWKDGVPNTDNLTPTQQELVNTIIGMDTVRLQLLFTSSISQLEPTNLTLTSDEFKKILIYLVYVGAINNYTFESVKRSLNEKGLGSYISDYNNYLTSTGSLAPISAILSSR